MSRTNDKSMKEAIEQMLNVYKIKRKFEETSVVAHWDELVGKSVANRTKEIYIHNKRLFLKIESSVIKNEIQLMHSQIIQKINEKAGTELIEEIIFLYWRAGLPLSILLFCRSVNTDEKIIRNTPGTKNTNCISG